MSDTKTSSVICLQILKQSAATNPRAVARRAVAIVVVVVVVARRAIAIIVERRLACIHFNHLMNKKSSRNGL
jgi:phage gp37-like protein